MIAGLGIDVVEVAKLAEQLAGETFVRRAFTSEEIEACRATPRPEECFAGKFAAKEACMKALGAGLRQGVGFGQIAVVNEASGAPRLRLAGEAARRLEALGAKRLHVSLSHTAGVAVAVVILETD